MTNLRRAAIYAATLLSLSAGCNLTDAACIQFASSADLNNSGSEERIYIEAHRCGECLIKIDELDRLTTRRNPYSGGVHFDYDNTFYCNDLYQLKLPRMPRYFELIDTNGDGYLDFIFFLTNKGDLKNKGDLMRYVSEQNGLGGFRQPKRLENLLEVSVNEFVENYLRLNPGADSLMTKKQLISQFMHYLEHQQNSVKPK